MAEFCLEHFNESFGKDFKANRVIRDIDFCECCGEWKPCVKRIVRRKGLLERVVEYKNLKAYYRDKPSDK